MISQVFLLSPRGDTLIYKDFRSNVTKACPPPRGHGAAWPTAPLRCAALGSTLLSSQAAAEVFFRKAKFWDGKGTDAPPVFQVEGVQYLHVKVRPPPPPLHRRCRPLPGSKAACAPAASCWCLGNVAGWPSYSAPRLGSGVYRLGSRVYLPGGAGLHWPACLRRWAACTGWPPRARTCPPRWSSSCCCACTGSSG